MAFALGLSGVYMAERLGWRSGDVWVDLPEARSGGVLPVFIDDSQVLTREKNCGLDPADPQARAACADQRLYGNRDLSLYTHHFVECEPTGTNNPLSVCRFPELKSKRDFIWHHWRNKTRAHLIVRYVYFGGRYREFHYFVEPSAEGRWHLVSRSRDLRTYFVLEQGAVDIPIVEEEYPRIYETHRWKTATKLEGPSYLPPGTRFLQFENITGDTVVF